MSTDRRSQKTWGVVSNCWKLQLDAGESLEQLIDQARENGFRAIELRQGTLGDFDSFLDHSSFAPDSFFRLGERFSDLAMNLAVSLPLFSPVSIEVDSAFQTALKVSIALSGGLTPHLRLVDTTTRTPRLDEVTIQRSAASLVTMTRQLIDHGGDLAVEHAYQDWIVFESVFRQARHLLGDDAHRLRCCFDPCNLLLTEPVDQVHEIVKAIRPEDVSMIHLKQRRQGMILPEVGQGDLDWGQLLATLETNQQTGPWLFEIAPSPQVWECLARSIQYLEME